MNREFLIPRNIEVLIKKAAVDKKFRQQLYRQRSAVAECIGLKLKTTEKNIIDHIPQEQLDKIISSTKAHSEHICIFRSSAASLMLFALGVLPFSAIAEEPVLKDAEKAHKIKTADKTEADKEKEKLLQEIKTLQKKYIMLEQKYSQLELDKTLLSEKLKEKKEREKDLEGEIKDLKKRGQELERKMALFIGIQPDREEISKNKLRNLQARYLPKLTGKILKINEKWDFVIVDLGKNNIIKVKNNNKEQTLKIPLQEALIMQVSRNGKSIGKLQVIKINDNCSTCNIISLADGEKIHVGDVVRISKNQQNQ